MTAIFDIRAAIRTRVLTVGSLPADKKWENKKFQPPANTEWLRETFMITSQRHTATGTIETLGIAQYDLLYPSDTGTNTADTVADALVAAFPPGTSLSGIQIYRAERGTAREESHWFMTPVSIYWRAFTIS